MFGMLILAWPWLYDFSAFFKILSVFFPRSCGRCHTLLAVTFSIKGSHSVEWARILRIPPGFHREWGGSVKYWASVTTQYGLPHYAYMTHWTCSFSFYLPYLLLTLCLIHTDNLVPLYDTTPLPLCPCPCSTYDTVLILSIVTSLFINTYVSLYLQVYIPCTSW